MHEEITHPCVRHKLALLRDRGTGYQEFRALAREITMFVCYEALKAVQVREVQVETPLATATAFKIDQELIVVPILRAGVGMLEGILDLVPTARVGFVGIFRDKQTKLPITYYERIPEVPESALYIVIDPMIATGGSTVATLDALKAGGARHIVVVCLVTCPEGLAAIAARHADVRVYTAAVDDHLDARKYIVPGLGDAGDRLFGTT